MSDIDALLADLAAKEAAATRRPRPLSVRTYSDCYPDICYTVPEPRRLDDTFDGSCGTMDDEPLADLIVAAVNALPALRGEIERLRAELARARGYEQEAVAHLRAVCDPCGNHVTAVMRARAWLVGDHDA